MEHSHATPKCYCDLVCKIYTSKKEPGREFYRCPKPFNIPSSTQCKFFLWLDEALPGQGLPPTPQSAQPGPSTARQPAPPVTPTPLRSVKRHFSDMEDDTPAPGPSPEKRSRTLTQEIQVALNQPAASSSPLVTRYGPDTSDTRRPQTPQRNYQVQSSSSFRALSPTPSPVPRPKFKPAQTNVATSTSYHPIEAPPSSQDTIGGNDAQELTADSIQSMLHSFGGIPEYVRKLERKKIAAEKSRDAKATKIAHLEAEVERLKRRETELEELVALLERDR